MTGPVLNLDDVAIQTTTPAGSPQGAAAERYDLRWGEIASRIGARKLGYNLTVVAPGKRACPFHSHRSDEEMFFILEGTGELRYLAVSTMEPMEICEYPDSGKFGVFADGVPGADDQSHRFRHIGRAGDARDYWEGE